MAAELTKQIRNGPHAFAPVVFRAAPRVTHVQLFNEDDLQPPGSPTRLNEWPPMLRWLWIDPAEASIESLRQCAHLRYLELVLDAGVDVARVVETLPLALEQLKLGVVGNADAIVTFGLLADRLAQATPSSAFGRLRHLTLVIKEWDAADTANEDRLRAVCVGRDVQLKISKSAPDDSDTSSQGDADDTSTEGGSIGSIGAFAAQDA